MALGHSPQIVTQGLVFYIDPSSTKSYAGFGNTIYNMVDSSIGGTFVGYTSNPIDNTFTRSIVFDGSSNYMSSNDISMNFSTSDFSIQTTLKLNGLSNGFTGAYGTVICAGSILTNNSSIFQFIGTATSHFAIGLWHQPTSTTIGRNFSFQTNKIYNIAVTKKSTQIEFFVDGVSIGTTSSSNNFNFTANGFGIGRWYYPGYEQYLKGNLFDLKSYNRALSATEILQNYNASKKKYSPDENIVTDGLVLNIDPGKSNSYPGTGNQIYDLSGSGNTGTLAASPVFSSLNGGQIGFNGTSQYITFGNKFSFTTENFSFSYWVFVNTFTTNQANQGPVVFWKGNFNENGYYCQLNSDGSIAFVTNSPSNQITSSGAGVVKLKYWHHISIVRNGSSVRLYCDGVDVTVTAATHSPSASNRDFLIANYNSFILANIQISQFQIYNRALNQQEVQQNYNATKNRFVNALPPVNDGSLSYFIDPGDVRSYSGTGNTIYNLVTSGFGGTIVGGVTYSGIGGTANFTFNGTNGWINIGNRPAKTTGSTISFFVKTTTTSQSFMVVCTSDGGVYINRFNTSGQILAFFDTSTGNNSSADISTVSINDGRWHYVTVLTNRVTTSMYIDGIFNKSYSETASTLASNYNIIGGSSLENNWFAGSIGIVQIHDRALSAVEIKQNFDYYRTRYGI